MGTFWKWVFGFSEICVKQIRVNQGLGVFANCLAKFNTLFSFVSVSYVTQIWVKPPYKIQALHTVLAKENDHVDHFIGFIYAPQTLTDSCQSI